MVSCSQLLPYIETVEVEEETGFCHIKAACFGTLRTSQIHTKHCWLPFRNITNYVSRPRSFIFVGKKTSIAKQQDNEAPSAALILALDYSPRKVGSDSI